MTFVDIVEITLKSGDGGDGMVSFHREKYVASGGPDGGDGGKGGDIVVVAREHLRTLLDFRFQRKYTAGNGAMGGTRLGTGKAGEDLIIEVPLGTLIKDEEGRIVADMNTADEPRILLRGGRGGRGNARFATPTRQSPQFATPGEKTRVCKVTLELKTIADVGLVGFPNVGKSTLLSVVSQARPKIADYHFTTLTPNLGVVKIDGQSFTMADIPGLIEDAHEGAGLGHDFLRHVERTRVLIHVVDMSGVEGRVPMEDYDQIMHELSEYKPELLELPMVVAANKMDIEPDAQLYLDMFREHVGPEVEIFPISAPIHEGVQALMRRVAQILRELPPQEPLWQETATLESRLEQTYTVEYLEDEDVFFVDGPLAQRLLDSVNLDDNHSVRHFHKMMEEKGILTALREAGATDGSTVRFVDTEFDFVE